MRETSSSSGPHHLHAQIATLTKKNEDLVKRLRVAAKAAETMEQMYSHQSKKQRELMQDNVILEHELATGGTKSRWKKQHDRDWWMSFLSTKNWLLEEVLTKKNVEIDDIKDNNEGLVQVLEEYEMSKHKYE